MIPMQTSETPPRLFTYASGGWVIVAAMAVGLVVFLLAFGPALLASGKRPPGDGKNPETYGFDLSHPRTPVARMAAAQLYRNMTQPLIDPPTLKGDAVLDFNDSMRRGKYLVSGDLVLGVVVGDEARAYPLSVLQVHELVNDTLGDQPILVSFNPLSYAAAAYLRTVAGSPRLFGTSGLVLNSNPLLFDYGPDEPADAHDVYGLWSQLRGEAITGAAAEAGAVLTRLPVVLMRWSDWLARHPETTVIKLDLSQVRRYRGTDYSRYYMTDRLLFPVDVPDEHPDGLPWKTIQMVFETPDGPVVRTYPQIESMASGGRWRDESFDPPITFHVRSDIPVIWPEREDAPLPPLLYTYLFAWEAR